MDGFPPDFTSVAKREVHNTDGYLWARSGPCLEALAFEANLAGRVYETINPDELDGYPLHERWFMGFLICQGSELAEAVNWAAKIAPDQRSRILILVAPAVQGASDRVAEVAPGCAVVELDVLNSAATAYRVHKTYGLAHAAQSYEDRFMPAPA